MNLNKFQSDSNSENSAAGSTRPSALTHLHYKCFPSSTALSNDLVTMAVRSFHLCNYKESSFDDSGSLTKASMLKKNRLIDQGVQLCVSAQILGIGAVPLHSNLVDSPASSVLCQDRLDNVKAGGGNEKIPFNSYQQISPTIDMNTTNDNYHAPSHRLSCTWDKESTKQKSSQLHHQQSQTNYHMQKSVLTLPVRYKDLSHDACVKFEIQTSRNKRIGTATLKLWDAENRLKTGLQKVKVKLTEFQAYQADISSDVIQDGKLQSVCKNTHECKDEKWEACLILDKIQQMQKMAKSRKVLSSAVKSNESSSTKQQNQQQSKSSDSIQLEDVNITLNGLENRHYVQNIPWLDRLTSSHCLDILNAQSDNKRTIYPIDFPEKDAYLIVELEHCDFPIVHHEQSYGNMPHIGGNNEKSINTNNDNAGNNNVVASKNGNSSAIGSITPIDLSLYYHEFTRIKQNNKNFEELNNYMVQMPNLVYALNESQEMGIKLVQVLDFESMDDNPVEDKYRTLQHELLRGLVDPALKPDAHERSQLNTIISGTSQHLSREEKDLLWRFRFSLVDNRRALTKFLLAVEWTVESEVIQAAELLEQWRKRSPIEVSDALKLLGRNVAFQTGLVRAYAIDTLALADDGELLLYLLQLVQALKYEINVDEQKGINTLKQRKAGGNDRKDNKSNISLASFLIERASKNIELANYLYWYLKVELDDPIYGQRYKEVLHQMKIKLSGIPFKIQPQTQTSFAPFSTVLDSVSKIGTGHSKMAPNVYRTMWNVLETQSDFISDIVECQLESRQARGRKEVKEKHLRETLQKRGCQKLDIGSAVPLPSAPQIWVTGVKSQTARMFKSALYPALIEFFVDKESSVHKGDDELKNTYRVMIKTGDDLRQDQLVIMMIKLMDRILKRGTLDLCLKPYPILAMSDKTGLVEFVPNSMAISQVLAENNYSILNFFQKVAPSKDAKYGVNPEVMQTYIRSCAGYCVITYIIGVGDRHLDNIMLQKSGHFFHIDFGFIFGRDPKPLPPAFRLTKEMVDGMGGQESQEYHQFCKFACQAYNLLRKRAGLLLNLLHLMSDAGIEDLSNNPSNDAEGVIGEVEKRFQLELTDEQAETFFMQQIKECLAAFAPRVMDVFHQMSVARR